MLQYLWVASVGSGCQGHLLNVSLGFVIAQAVSGYCLCLVVCIVKQSKTKVRCDLQV